MDQVPIEIVEKIFHFLSLCDLNECRKVCKKWNFVVECVMKFECLVVLKRSDQPINKKFFHSNQPIDCRYSIGMDSFNSKFRKRIYNLFKRVYFYDQFDYKFSNRDLGQMRDEELKLRSIYGLNYLSQLRELHLTRVDLDKDLKLDLPNLETLKLSYVWFYTLTLKTTQLINLSVCKLKNIKLKHPKKIKFFEFLGQKLEFAEREKLTKFTNLVYLSFQHYEYNADRREGLDLNHLLSFKRLKVLNVYKAGFFDKLLFDEYNQHYWILKELKKRSKDLQVFIGGIEANVLFSLTDRDLEQGNNEMTNQLIKKSQTRIYVFNKPNLSEQLPFYAVNYNAIEEFLDDNPDLFGPKKLTNLQTVSVKKMVGNEDRFANWLQKFSNLVGIEIECCSLSQKFFSNTLPVFCPNIEYFNLQVDKSNYELIDFTFLLKFKFLQEICFGNHLDFDLIESLFRNLNYLKFLTSCNYNKDFGDVTIDFRKQEFADSVLYEVDTSKSSFRLFQHNRKFDCLKNLFDFLNDLKSKDEIEFFNHRT